MKYRALAILGASGAVIYMTPYIRYIAYDWMRAALSLSNTQIGLLSAVYSVLNALLYIPGGLIADRVSPKKCVALSLAATSALTFILAALLRSGIPLPFPLALALWACYSLTTAFVFWTALIVLIRHGSRESEQGFRFGIYYMANGLASAACALLGLFLARRTENARDAFFSLIITTACAQALFAALTALLVHDPPRRAHSSHRLLSKTKRVRLLLRHKGLWLFALIMFAAYALYVSASYFTPWLVKAARISSTSSASIAIVRSYACYALAPLGGLIADRLFRSRIRYFTLLFALLAALFAGLLFLPPYLNSAALIAYTLAVGAAVVMLHGILFSLAGEVGIPSELMGTAAGIISIVAFAPDFFLETLYGRWLDTVPEAAYPRIFTLLVCIALAGTAACGLLHGWRGRRKAVRGTTGTTDSG